MPERLQKKQWFEIKTQFGYSEHSACRIDAEVAVGKAVVALGLEADSQCKSLPFRIEKMSVFALSNTGFQQFFRPIWRQQEVQE